MLAAYRMPRREARRALHERLLGVPGFTGGGVVLQNPHDPQHAWRYAYQRCRAIDGIPVKLVLVDEYPKALRR